MPTVNEFPALIRLRLSGYELIVYGFEDIPRGCSFDVLERCIERLKRI